MKPDRMMILLAVIFAFVVFFEQPRALALSPEGFEQFEKANDAYASGSYDQAIELYQDLIFENGREAALYYNLGNAYFRKGNLGRAILNYEKALMVEPRHTDSRHNLAYVRSLLEYRIDDNRNWYIRTGEKILELFSERELMILSFFAYFLFIGGCVWSLFYRHSLSWHWPRKVTFTLFVFTLLLVAGKSVETRVIRDAVVVAAGADVRYGPSDADQIAFRLGEGLKVHVVDRRSGWSRIILVNGNGGWIKNSDIEQVLSA